MPYLWLQMPSVLFLSVLVATQREIMRLSVPFSDEDLYRGAEELTASQDNGAGFLPPCQSISSLFLFLFFLCLIPLRVTEGMSVNLWNSPSQSNLVCSGCHMPTLVLIYFSVLNVEDRCSLAPAMDILSYSEREWRGNTAKSALIRKVGG